MHELAKINLFLIGGQLWYMTKLMQNFTNSKSIHSFAVFFPQFFHQYKIFLSLSLAVDIAEDENIRKSEPL
jgi:hypothetical protein